MLIQAKIQQISPKRMRKVISRYSPQGRFLSKQGHKWVAVDNSTCDAWTEEFRCKRHAIRWLRGEFEVGDRAKK